MSSFVFSPSVIASFNDEVDFFVHVLADVTTTKVGRSSSIERTSPGVSKSIGKNFGAVSKGKRIIGRNVVREIGILTIDIDAKNLAMPSVQVLGIIVRIISKTSVSNGNVEVTIGSKVETSGFVISKRLVDDDQDAFCIEIGRCRIIDIGLVFGDDGTPIAIAGAINALRSTTDFV